VIGAAIVGCVLALTPALGGHARTQSPAALLVPADVVHVVAMSAWLGGLAFLLFAVPAATRVLEPADRTRLLAAALSRFSQLALISVAALATTGVIQALVEVRHLDALTGTAFGRAVLIKAVLLAILIAIAAVNRRRAVPELERLAAAGAAPGDAGRLLRRTLRAEVALIVVVLAVTGCAHRLRAVDGRLGEHGARLGHPADGSARPAAHRRPGPGGAEPGPPLPVRRQERGRVRRHEGAEGQGRPARQGHRPARP
jgi:putative copper export protein